MIRCEYTFKDGKFSFYTAIFGSWNKDRRLVFRVREDSSPRKRAKEKGIKGYDRIFLASNQEIRHWINTHSNYPILYPRNRFNSKLEG